MEADDLLFCEAQPEEFGELILSRFGDSTKEEHQHLCTVVGATSQELRDKGLPLTPVAYFGAVCSSLDHLLSYEADPPVHAVESLTKLLSLVLPKLQAPIVTKKLEFVSGLVVRVLKWSFVSEGGAISGLKCVGHLMKARNCANWIEISQPFGILLNYISDSRPKVRRQAHVCTRDVLQHFQGTPSLAHASKAITNAFEKLLLLVGGSKSDSNEGSRRAQEVLHFLDAYKEFLSLVPLEYMAKILNYFKTLLGLSQPLVTKRLTDCLNAICLHSATEVPAEVFLDLLCALAVTVSASEASAVGLAFVARLLGVGMIKICSVDRNICIVKLPLIFSTLKDILASEHEEAIYAAGEAFKGLIDSCIDEFIILEGVNELPESSLEGRKPRPTTIEKLCVILESLLDYQYSEVWDVSFQVITAMFNKTGEYASYLLKGVLQNLAAMQKFPDEDFPYRKQLHNCVGSALAAMGPEKFLGIVPLQLESADLSDVNVWLFPILKHHIVGARLSFFVDSIMPSIEMMKCKAQKFEAAGRIVSSRSADSLVYSLWSLLPSFCNYPMDTAESFKDLVKLLGIALQELPDLRGIICASVNILIQQNKGIVHNKGLLSADDADIPTQKALSFYTLQVAEDNLKALGSCAGDLLKIISKIFLDCSKDDGGCLQSAIGELASVSDKRLVKVLFKKKMHQLLEVTQQAGSDSMNLDDMPNEDLLTQTRARLLDLAVSLLPGLDERELDLLFTAIKPELQCGEGLIQKKAYKVLSVILRDSDTFISSKQKELLKLMTEVLPSCHFPAKRHRLDCLHLLIAHVSRTDHSEQMQRDIMCAFITEIILALKEPNKKTRNRAYEVLVQIGHAYGDEENGGRKENLDQLFSMVADGMAGDSPHLISAAVKGLARLAYEFSDLISAAYKLLPSTFLLFRKKNNEIIKANLGLLKVLVVKSPVEGLQAHLKSMVEGLLKWQDGPKNHFRAKVKVLLELLIRKCGIDAVKSVMPEEHMKLLTNIRKIKERKEKKQSTSSSEHKSQISKSTGSRLSKWNHTTMFSVSGEEDDSDADDMDASTLSRERSKASLLKSKASMRSKKKGKGKSLPADDMDQIEDEPLNLLDRSKTRSALRSSCQLKRKADSDDEPEFDPEGKLIIREGAKPRRRPSSDPDSDSKSETRSQMSMMSKRGQKRIKVAQSGYAYTGSEYASKKASGDVRRKDKLEPYAYWPLDRKMMSRRPEHRASARRGMSSVVKVTKQLEGKSVSSALSMKLTKMKKVKRGGKKRSN